MDHVTVNIINPAESEEEAEETCRYKFFVQFGVCLLVVGFAVFSIVTSGDDWSEKDIYIAVISAIVGLYLPQPKISG
jgi:hypothetical protein